MDRDILGYEEYNKFFGRRELSEKRDLVSIEEDIPTDVKMGLDIKICKSQS